MSDIKSSMLNSEEIRDQWGDLFYLLPVGLQSIINFEISKNNRIVGVQKYEWPNLESVVVKMENRFHPSSRTFSEKCHWRLLNDPHYCREEISERVGSTEHLIIA